MTGRPIRELIGPASRPYESEHRRMSGMLGFWDLSLHPKNNSKTVDPKSGRTEREKKLGSFGGAHGAAICEHDPITLTDTLADGISRNINIEGKKKTSKSKYPSRFLLEPDNWTLRLHEEDGLKNDCTWDLRLVADHSNKHNERTNRSTMVIDQQDRQRWGHLSEVFWVKDVLVNTPHKELFFDAAGFLEGMCDEGPTVTGQGAPPVVTIAGGQAVGISGPVPPNGKPRYHVALNMNREAGFLTDGCRVGQIAHILTLRDALATGTNRDGEKLVMAALRADVRFFSNDGQWGPLAFGSTPPGVTPGVPGGAVAGACVPLPVTDGEIITGRHWWGPRTTQCIGTDAPCIDASEDGRQIPEPFLKDIWVYVKIPRCPSLPVIDNGRVPPAFPSQPPALTSPVSDTVGVTDAARFSKSGAVGTGGWIPIPLDLPETWGINVTVNLSPAENDADPALTSRWQFDAVIVGDGESLTPAGLDGTATVFVTDTPLAGDPVLDSFTIHIPRSMIVNERGGKVFFALYRRGALETASANQRRAYVIGFHGGCGTVASTATLLDVAA